MGAKVIAAAGTASKLAVAQRAGADFGVDYTKPKWQQEVLKITKGHGADVIYDPVGMIQGSYSNSLFYLSTNADTIVNM